jgi:TPR repeat protein
MEKIIFFLLACFAWQGSVASAVELEQGIKLFEQKKYDQAKKLWQPLAEKGDARAQYNMVILFLKMQNKVPTDLQRQQANQYLAMSRSEGLVDGYFVTMPEIKLKGDDIDESLTWLNQQIKST